MRFTVSNVSAFLAMVASVLAQDPNFDAVYSPQSGQQVPAGTTLTIMWEVPKDPAYDGTITINLIGGPTQATQVQKALVVAGIPNSQGSYQWNIPGDLIGDTFNGLEFTLDSNPSVMQFSNPFQIVGGTGGQVSVAPTNSAPASGAPSQTMAPGPVSQTTGAAHSSTPASSAAPSSSAPATQQTTVAQQTTTSVIAYTPSMSTTLSTTTRAASSTVVPPPSSSSSSSEPPAAPTQTSSDSGSGVAPVRTMTSTAWTVPTNPPVPTDSATPVIPTSGAARTGSSLAIIGGLIAAFLAL